jgi:riboflavin transporter FmnP
MKLNIMGLISAIIVFMSIVLPWYSVSGSPFGDVHASLWNFVIGIESIGGFLVGTLWFVLIAFALIIVGGILGLVGSFVIEGKGKNLFAIGGALVILSPIIFAAGLASIGLPLFLTVAGTTVFLSFGFFLAFIATTVMFISTKKVIYKYYEMNTKTIATVVVFVALTMVLNLWGPKIPAPYLTFLKYQIWEIPIVTAFLLFGPLVGALVAIANTLMLFVVYPGDLPTGPLYNLAAVLGMLFGIYLIHKILAKRSGKQNEAIIITSSTVFGIALRVGIMTIINYALLRFPPPVGYNIPEEGILAMLPLIGIFNATLALYTVPVGHFIAKAVRSAIKTL